MEPVVYTAADNSKMVLQKGFWPAPEPHAWLWPVPSDRLVERTGSLRMNSGRPYSFLTWTSRWSAARLRRETL